MLVIGIDPGKMGAIALLDGTSLTFEPMPLVSNEWSPRHMNERALEWREMGAQRVVIEQCHAFPGISAAANAEVMRAYGMWQGVLACHFDAGMVLEVPANVWKKEMGLIVPIVKAGKKATAKEKTIAYLARKQRSLDVAREKFPLHSFVTPRGRDLDGEAEAALLALYGRVAWPKSL